MKLNIFCIQTFLFVFSQFDSKIRFKTISLKKINSHWYPRKDLKIDLEIAKLKSKQKADIIPKFVDQINVNIPIDQLLSSSEKNKVLSHQQGLVQKHLSREHRISSKFNKSFIQTNSNNLVNDVQNMMDIASPNTYVQNRVLPSHPFAVNSSPPIQQLMHQPALQQISSQPFLSHPQQSQLPIPQSNPALAHEQDPQNKTLNIDTLVINYNAPSNKYADKTFTNMSNNQQNGKISLTNDQLFQLLNKTQQQQNITPNIQQTQNPQVNSMAAQPIQRMSNLSSSGPMQEKTNKALNETKVSTKMLNTTESKSISDKTINSNFNKTKASSLRKRVKKLDDIDVLF